MKNLREKVLGTNVKQDEACNLFFTLIILLVEESVADQIESIFAY